MHSLCSQVAAAVHSFFLPSLPVGEGYYQGETLRAHYMFYSVLFLPFLYYPPESSTSPESPSKSYEMFD